jgi:hypothetical protein
MTAHDSLPLSRIEGRKLLEYLGVVLLIASVCGILAYAAAVSYSAAFKLERLDPRAIAEHAFFTTGSLGIIGALLLLTLQG